MLRTLRSLLFLRSLLGALALAPSLLLAQTPIVLQETDFGSSRDTTLSYHRNSGIGNYAPTDANQTGVDWDFTNLIYESTNLVNLLRPENTADGSLFPTASYAAEIAEELFAFLRVTPDSAVQLGFGGNAQSLLGVGVNFVAVYDEPLQQAHIPVTYGQTLYQETGFDQTFPVSFGVISEARVKRNIRRRATIDAAGTLTIPSLNQIPVLRQATADTTQDSIWVRVLGSWHNGYEPLGIPAVVNDTNLTYSWWGQERMSHLLSIVVSPRNNVRSLQYLADSFSVSRMQSQAAPTIRIYPNPSSGGVRVSGAPADAVLKVWDAQGRMCAHTSANAEIQLPNLPAGMYLTQVMDGNGRQLHSQRLVIQ